MQHTILPLLNWARLLKKTKPDLLILHHILFWGATEEELLDEISQIYDGLVSVGSDMMIY